MQTEMVEFRIADIVHPQPAQVLVELYEKNRLEGKVLAVTDDGMKPKSLLVVRVPGVSEPVIVPVAKTVPCESIADFLVEEFRS